MSKIWKIALSTCIWLKDNKFEYMNSYKLAISLKISFIFSSYLKNKNYINQKIHAQKWNAKIFIEGIKHLE